MAQEGPDNQPEDNQALDSEEEAAIAKAIAESEKENEQLKEINH